jgi:hypothetical protein
MYVYDYGEFGYQLEPEYTEEELGQMEEAARDHLNLATTILTRVEQKKSKEILIE